MLKSNREDLLYDFRIAGAARMHLTHHWPMATEYHASCMIHVPPKGAQGRISELAGAILAHGSFRFMIMHHLAIVVATKAPRRQLTTVFSTCAVFSALSIAQNDQSDNNFMHTLL